MHPANSRYSKGTRAKEREKMKTGPTTQGSCKLKTAEKSCQLRSEKVPFQMQRLHPRLLIHVPNMRQEAPGQHRLRAEGGCLGESGPGPQSLRETGVLGSSSLQHRFSMSPAGPFHLQMNLQLYLRPRLLL